MKKKIVFIHFHFRTGGVTTVVKQQVEAVKNQCDILVLSGEFRDLSFPVPTLHIPGLGYYDGPSKNHFYDPQQVAESVIEAIHSRFNGKCDIIHVHNPLISKNVIFIEILNRLKKEGNNLFLQVHDFAEDGRPTVYFYDSKYISNCHYGAVNLRDYQFLLDSGLTKQGLHLIPNQVNVFNFNKHKDKVYYDRQIVLYPVRARRRKNIGEAILLSLFFKNDEALCITLPPESSDDIESYIGWKKFVKTNDLPVEFDKGLQNDFEKLLFSAKILVTTSITEGFGFSFLEPWMAGKFLYGRKLENICLDFEKNGLDFNNLYTKFYVPLEWIEKEIFFERWRACVLKNCETYNYNLNKKDIAAFFKKITENECIDFGLLDESFQKNVISVVLNCDSKKERLVELNPKILIPEDLSDKNELIKNNMNVLTEKYSKAVYRKRLIDIYSKVAKNKVSHEIDKKILLSGFFNLEEFSLLKWGKYIE